MIWPFKRKQTADEIELDELLGRVKAEVKARGGFCFIGLRMQDRDGVAAAVLVHNFSKHKAVYTVATALEMDVMDMMTAVARYSKSKVTSKPHAAEPTPSPITREDLKK